MFWIEVRDAIWKHQPGHVTIPKETPDGRPIVVIICVRDPRSVAVAHQKNADSASWVRPSGSRTRKWNTQGMAAEELIYDVEDNLSFETQLAWLFKPVKIFHGIAGNLGPKHDTFFHWIHDEYELIRTGQKVLNRNGLPHRNTIVIRANELFADPAMVMAVLGEIGLKMDSSRCDAEHPWPRILEQHVKDVRSTRDKTRNSMLQFEMYQLDVVMPLTGFLRYMMKKYPRRLDYDRIYKHFHWDADQDMDWKDSMCPHVAGSTFNTYIWPDDLDPNAELLV